jgi:hypothetical protein
VPGGRWENRACPRTSRKVPGSAWEQLLGEGPENHLSWAFGQAAHFARRYQPQARKFYQRKLAQRGPVVANRALAHKLSRAVYFMLRDQTRFDPGRLFQ